MDYLSENEVDMNQAMMFVTTYYPTLWKALYDELMKKGFSEEQTIRLLCAYIGKIEDNR